MLKDKGITAVPGLLLFALIVVATITVIYFVSMVPVLDDVVAIKAQAQLYLEIDDRGGAFASFIQTKIVDMSYAEILGDLSASNHPEGIDYNLKTTLDKLEAELELYQSAQNVWNHGEVSGYTISADVALPGVKKGEVRVS